MSLFRGLVVVVVVVVVKVEDVVVLCVVDIVKAAPVKISFPFSIFHLPFVTGRRLVSQVEPHLTKILGGALLVHPFNWINLHIFRKISQQPSFFFFAHHVTFYSI